MRNFRALSAPRGTIGPLILITARSGRECDTGRGCFPVIAGKATPSAIVSHELPLTEAPAAYEKFDKRIDGYTKVLLHPAV